MKTTLTEREFIQIKDLVCDATICKDADNKQYFLLKIGGIMTGLSAEKFRMEAVNQGYQISKGEKP